MVGLVLPLFPKGCAMSLPSSEFYSTTDHLDQLLQAIESNPVIIVVTDTNGNIQHVNSKFCEISGFSLAEILGQSAKALGELSAEEECQMWDKLRAGM